MLNDNLNSSFYKKNAAQKYFTKILHIFVKSQKKIMLTLLLVPNIFIFQNELIAETQGREVQIFVRSGSALQARKRKAYENSQKEKGLKIKRYLINKSALQSKKGKSAAATKKWLNRVWLHLKW